MTRSRLGLAACLHALLIVYASTVIGPMGLHFVPMDPEEALSRLLAVHIVDNGSDQRADWIGNLMMLAPLGFLLAGAFSRRRAGSRARLTIPGAACALIVSAAFILVVKYAQLFFPPRTVTLNYIIAQSSGAGVGVVLFGLLGPTLDDLGRDGQPLKSLRLLLWLYTAALVIFLLEPLDFALNAEDLAGRFDALPASFTAISGAGRPAPIQAAILAAGIAAFLPVGMLLTLKDQGRLYVGRSAFEAATLGFFGTVVIYALTALTLSGAPTLIAIPMRTAGIALGAIGTHRLTRANPEAVRRLLVRLTPLAIPAYLAALAVVNGLVSRQWTTPDAGLAAIGPRNLIPLYNYYIVSKAQAATSLAAHAVMYAPVGVLAWLLTRGGGRGGAAMVAFLLAALIEGARLLRPGLQPDINAVPLAAVSAWVAASITPELWRMLEAIARPRPPLVGPSRPRESAPPAGRPRAGVEAAGEVENY
jgi:VanZ family protein